MDKFAELAEDIGKLLVNYWPLYLSGIGASIILALVATAIGCVIGLVCGILNTIPYSKNDSSAKKFFLKTPPSFLEV